MEYKDLFNKAKERNITNIQVTETTTDIAQIEVINKKLETYESSYTITYNIKAEYNNKTVKLVSDYLSEEILDLIIMKSEYTDSAYQDDYLTNTKENNQLDSSHTVDVSKELEKLYELDKYRKKYPEVSKLITFYADNYEQKRIINSNGVDIKTSSHLYEFIIEAIVEKDGEFTSFDKKYLKTSKEELAMDEYVKDIIEKCIKLSEKEKLSTQKYNIILDTTVMTQILSRFKYMISAADVRKKISCFENKLDEKIFSDKLTIKEEPTNKKYPGYTIFDDEGTKTKDKNIIDKGVLKSYLYDIKEAKEKDVETTANGYGTIDTRNMYIVPGEKNLESLFKELDNGIYITDSMGSMDTAINSNTGAISLQIFGFIIENGHIKNGFEPSVLTTTIFELLTNIKEIGNNLEFQKKSVASPALLIENISIAGKE